MKKKTLLISSLLKLTTVTMSHNPEKSVCTDIFKIDMESHGHTDVHPAFFFFSCINKTYASWQTFTRPSVPSLWQRRGTLLCGCCGVSSASPSSASPLSTSI